MPQDRPTTPPPNDAGRGPDTQLHGLAGEATDRARVAADIFDAAPVGLCIVKDRVHVRANRFWCEFLGYSEAALRGQQVRVFYADDAEYERVGRELYGPLHEQGFASVETRLRRRDGAWRDVILRAVPVRRGDPSSEVILGVLDITERKRAEQALACESLRRRLLFEQSPDGVLILDPATAGFLDFNTAAHRQLGYTREAFALLTVRDIEARESPEDTRIRIAEVMRQGRVDFETLHRTRQGEIRNVHVTAQWVDIHGQPTYHCIWRDITERKRAEAEQARLQAQLTQAQKMESVGRLAGGVAHDFNNMLQTILGNLDLALADVPTHSPMRETLEEIQKAAQRSAELTRQLLAFARKQPVAPKVLDLNATVEGMLKMLRRLIGEQIELVWAPGLDAGSISADPSQIDQILTNLCVNARDAIDGPGRVGIETGGVAVDRVQADRHPDAVPGNYVCLTVRDNGRGMGGDVMAHLFEPFFTTKPSGAGTGLGLATIYGIVKQNRGFITVQSAPGQGATFRVHLPRHRDPNSAKEAEAPGSVPDGGQETILLVDDEPAVLRVGKRMLESLGYTVLAATTPSEAIRLAESHAGAIDLLVTDVVMPEMNGRALAERLLKHFPKLQRLFMSGYTADVISNHGVLDPGVHFLSKPFTVRSLAEHVREALRRREGLGP